MKSVQEKWCKVTNKIDEEREKSVARAHEASLLTM